MPSGGGGGGTNTVQSSDPWAGQQPYLEAGYGAANNYLNSGGANYYQGDTVSNLSPQTIAANVGMTNYGNSEPYQTGLSMAGQGLGTLGSLASGSTPGQAALNDVATHGAGGGVGVDTLTATARGDMLNAENPYFQGMLNNTLMAGRANLDSTYAAAGRQGSGAQAAAAADAAMRASTGLGYQNYTAERQNQLGAASSLNQYNLSDAQMRATAGLQSAQLLGQSGQQAMAGGQQYAQMGMLPLQTQGQAGAQFDAYNQSLLNAKKTAYDFGQNRDLTALQNYTGLIQGNYGGTTTSTVTGGNPTLQAIGGAAGLAGGVGQLGTGAYNMLGSPSSWFSSAGGGGDAAAAATYSQMGGFGPYVS